MENEWTREIERLKWELEETKAELAEAKKVIGGFLEVMEIYETVEGRRHV
jgi:hypothetical protein